MTLAGGAIGIAVGESLAFVLSLAFNIPFAIQPTAVLLAFGVAAFVGIVFGIYPAQRAAKMSPIDALRYE